MLFRGMEIAVRYPGNTAMIQRRRDPVQGSVSLDYFQGRFLDGWKLVSVEWEKETADEPSSRPEIDSPMIEDPPYGFEVAADGKHLQQNPWEISVLLTVLEMTVLEKRISAIADELNRRGSRTRDGSAWTSAAVFNLLPRLVEMGPRLMQSNEWIARRSAPVLS
jgi:hypothetical protein